MDLGKKLIIFCFYLQITKLFLYIKRYRKKDA